MSQSGRNLRMGLLAASVILAIPAFAATASAHDPSSYQGGGYYPYSYTYQDPYAAHDEAEQSHVAGERNHVWHEQRERDEADDNDEQ